MCSIPSREHAVLQQLVYRLSEKGGAEGTDPWDVFNDAIG